MINTKLVHAACILTIIYISLQLVAMGGIVVVGFAALAGL